MEKIIKLLIDSGFSFQFDNSSVGKELSCFEANLYILENMDGFKCEWRSKDITSKSCDIKFINFITHALKTES